MTSETAKNGITFYRVNSDIYGNPRYVIHFTDLLTKKEREEYSITSSYAIAVKRSHKAGGSKYRGKDFGGGIVFQSYNVDETAEHIAEIVKAAE